MDGLEIKARIKKSVLSIDQRAQIFLYGSQAVNKGQALSDWDILVLVDGQAVKFSDEQKFRHSLYEIELDINQPISTFVYAKNDWHTRMKSTPLYNQIATSGIEL